MIAVVDHVPPFAYHGDFQKSYPVLVYAAGAWLLGVYCSYRGRTYWEYATEGVSGDEWEVEEIEHVTHWLSLESLPTPEA